ncbi:MAG: AGE family epimerase/isomerase [Bacteroidales bacterium]|nr:AGE family epimerase/isomerase [Bacteroidales bacterium]
MNRIKPCIIVLSLIILSSCKHEQATKSDFFSGDYWKSQALNDIMPYWTRYSRDMTAGAFYTNLDSAWNTFGSLDKYPSMISRHLFSYSAAYLLSGNAEDIVIADSTTKWLIRYAWDKEFGGWFDALDRNGNPVRTTKTTFVQVYAVTGLTLYYFATRDTTALRYIERSNDLLESKVWDKESGGYYNVMNRDWSISDSNKSFSSQVTPVSGYLFYLYLATREEKYLNQISRILDVTVNNMVDPESGWVLEDFERNWTYLEGREGASEINIGHNIEVAWMLLRNYLLTRNNTHLQAALSLAAKLSVAGFMKDNGIWLTSTGRLASSQQATDTYWWIQAYGNIFSLYLYRATGEIKYLADFRKGAAFWDSEFIDPVHGDTYFSVGKDGTVKDATKATQFKTSYHSIEHCLLNMLCLNHWVNDAPVELNFRINASDDGDRLFPVLLEDWDIRIQRILIDGKDQTSRADNQAVVLPILVNSHIKVVLSNRD